MMRIGGVGRRQQRSAVDDQHLSVTPEALRQHLIGVDRASAIPRCAQAHEPEMPLALADAVGRKPRHQLGDHVIQAQPTTRRLGTEPGKNLIRQLEGDWHITILRDRPIGVSVQPRRD
jgi:hypothetical protein